MKVIKVTKKHGAPIRYHVLYEMSQDEYFTLTAEKGASCEVSVTANPMPVSKGKGKKEAIWAATPEGDWLYEEYLSKKDLDPAAEAMKVKELYAEAMRVAEIPAVRHESLGTVTYSSGT